MDYFLQQLINGISLGAIYGLIAVGYTMVYGIIGMINFAHGDIYMVGAFISLIGFLIMASIGISVPFALIIVLFAAMALTAVYGWTVERIAYRPLRGSNRLAPLISAIGMSIVLQNYVQIAQGARSKSIPPVITGGFDLVSTGKFHVTVSTMQVIVVVLTAILMFALTWLIQSTPLGRAQRATEQDPTMAALSGVDVDRTISITFIIGAALAAVAGLMVTLYYGVIDFYIGFLAGIKAFTAAVLGGIGSIPGAVLGGTPHRHHRSVVVRLCLDRLQGRRGVRHSGSGSDHPPLGPSGPARNREGLMADATAPAPAPKSFRANPIAGMVLDALAAAVIAALLAAPMLGVRLVDAAGGITLSYRTALIGYAAAIVFAGRLAILAAYAAFAHRRPHGKAHSRLALYKPKAGQGQRYAAYAILAVALILPFFADRNLTDKMTLILIYVMLGVGLNITVGLAGLLDLGYVAFYAVGAYSYALLAQHFDLSFWVCLPLAGLFAAATGLLIGFPILRLRGDYLAIVTLGFWPDRAHHPDQLAVADGRTRRHHRHSAPSFSACRSPRAPRAA